MGWGTRVNGDQSCSGVELSGASSVQLTFAVNHTGKVRLLKLYGALKSALFIDNKREKFYI